MSSERDAASARRIGVRNEQNQPPAAGRASDDTTHLRRPVTSTDPSTGRAPASNPDRHLPALHRQGADSTEDQTDDRSRDAPTSVVRPTHPRIAAAGADEHRLSARAAEPEASAAPVRPATSKRDPTTEPRAAAAGRRQRRRWRRLLVGQLASILIAVTLITAAVNSGPANDAPDASQGHVESPEPDRTDGTWPTDSAEPTVAPTPTSAPTPSAPTTTSPADRGPRRTPTSAAESRPAARGPARIAYRSFDSITGLALNGSAAKVGSALRLTPNAGSQTGSAWSRTTLNTARPFSTRFRMSLWGRGGDGVVFVVQGMGPRALGQGGSGLGYGAFLDGYPTIRRSVAVEFDTFRSDWESDGNHVAITTNGAVTRHIVVARPGFLMANSTFTAWVDYDARRTLRVYVSGGTVKPVSPVVETAIDLTPLVGAGPAYAGFTAATGWTAGAQDINSWHLTN